VRSRERLQLVPALRARALRVGRIALAAALCATVVTASARAQDRFAAAEQARANAQLDEAQQAYEAVLASGVLGLSEVAHAHLRLAELAFSVEDLETADRHLRYALALRPDAPVAEGPQLMQDAAAAILVERAQRPLRAVLEVSDASSPIRIDLRDAPPGLVRVIRVRGPEAYTRTLAWDGQAHELDPPAASRPIGVRLLDAHGNALGSAGVWPAPEVVATVVAPPVLVPEPREVAQAALEVEPEEEGDDVIENPWLWVAIGVVLVVAGVAVGFSASGDRYTVGAPVAP